MENKEQPTNVEIPKEFLEKIKELRNKYKNGQVLLSIRFIVASKQLQKLFEIFQETEKPFEMSVAKYTRGFKEVSIYFIAEDVEYFLSKEKEILSYDPHNK